MTEFEHCLRDALAALLEVALSQVSTTVSFEELGVDSLIGLRFARKVHDLTGIEVDVEWVFDYPTLAQLAAFLDTQRNGARARTAR